MRGFHFHFKRTTKRMISAALLFTFALALTTSRAPSTLESVLASGVLRILTLPGSTTYFKDAKGEGGFDFLLAKAFAESLGVTLEVRVMDNLNRLLLSVGGSRGQFATAGLAATPKRQQILQFSAPYDEVTQKLIYQSGTRRPKTIDDLAGGLLVAIPKSSHSEQLSLLQQEHPDLRWEEIEGLEMLELMELVHTGEIDYAVVDSNSYLIDRSIYPKAKAAFDISDPQPVVWAFPLGKDNSLLNAANEFLSRYRDSGELAELRDRFFGHADQFSLAGSQLFMRRVTSRLPKFERMFKEAAREFGIDWHFLAAVAYQESHWDPVARSPTGVRGLMMLTRITAKEMGITNRLDPEQSLTGGAKYYLKTKGRMPKDILDPDRTWMALASYNVGLGHLEDARVLTQRHGKDPHLWDDVKLHLPLLQKKKYHGTVKHGYARGQEPVNYVRNIRHYQKILELSSLEKQRRRERESRVEMPNSSDWNPDSMLSL